MTRPAPLRLGLSPVNFQALEILAGQARRSPDTYVEEGLTLAIWAARAVLNNELDEIPVTGLLLVKDSVICKAYNLSAILRQTTAPPVSQEPLSALTELGIEDPFITDERIPLDIDPELLNDAEAICAELQTPLPPFTNTSIDLRGIIFTATQRKQQALIQTAVAGEFIDLASSLADRPEDL